MQIVDAQTALQRLKDGNARYVADQPLRPNQSMERLREVSGRQYPFACIVGCSDSRAPAEILFDQGIGDLFVIRTAGHRVDDLAIASVEFAVKELGVRLVVVMGHQSCGAISAAMNMPAPAAEAWTQPGIVATNHIPRLLAKLQDVIERSRTLPGNPVENAVKENTRTVEGVLMRSSSVLQEASSLDGMRIVGAYYSLDTGIVEWLE
jgi:carbonic anhydrase